MSARRLAAALCLTSALLGCGGEEVFFDLDVRDFRPGDGCTFPLAFDAWALLVRQGTEVQCVRGPCAEPGPQPFACVAGAQTPPVTPDEPVTLTLGLYAGDSPPAACAQRTLTGGVREGSVVVLEMQCGATELTRCPQRLPVDPTCPPE